MGPDAALPRTQLGRCSLWHLSSSRFTVSGLCAAAVVEAGSPMRLVRLSKRQSVTIRRLPVCYSYQTCPPDLFSKTDPPDLQLMRYWTISAFQRHQSLVLAIFWYRSRGIPSSGPTLLRKDASEEPKEGNRPDAAGCCKTDADAGAGSPAAAAAAAATRDRQRGRPAETCSDPRQQLRGRACSPPSGRAI